MGNSQAVDRKILFLFLFLSVMNLCDKETDFICWRNSGINKSQISGRVTISTMVLFHHELYSNMVTTINLFSDYLINSYAILI